MSFIDAKAKLAYAMQKKRLHWDETVTQWNDQVSRDFERQHLDPLQPKVHTALQAIDRLAEIIHRCAEECR